VVVDLGYECVPEVVILLDGPQQFGCDAACDVQPAEWQRLQSQVAGLCTVAGHERVDGLPADVALAVLHTHTSRSSGTRE
jgi:hypothetical protein